MAININRKISPYNHFNYNTVTYIVEHDVGTVSTAKNNADFFYGGDRGASAHYFVHGRDIWQVVEDYHGAWHVGDGFGAYGITNVNSIGIEMCLESNRKVSELTKQTTIELTKMLQSKHGVPNSRVVRHYDASRKRCPGSMADNNWAEWNAFKERINSGQITGGATVNKPSTPSKGVGLGKVAKVAPHASAWAKGGKIPKWILGQEYKIIQKEDISKSHSNQMFLLEGVNSWILSQDLVGGYGSDKIGKPTAPAPKPSGGLISANGSYTVKVTTNIRNGASTKHAIAGSYAPGQSFNYDSYIDAEGYRWYSYISYSGQRRYVAAVNGTSTPKPPAKPAPAIKGSNMASSGSYTFTTTTNIRSGASTGHAIVGSYSPGETVFYDSKVISGGYTWLSYIGGSGLRRYVAVV